MKEDKEILSYYSAHESPHLPSIFKALGLCIMGAFCWLDYLTASFLPDLSNDLGEWWELHFIHPWFWRLLPVAIVTAIISVVIYGPKLFQPKPWFVKANLIINISGLIMASPVIFGGIFAAALSIFHLIAG